MKLVPRLQKKELPMKYTIVTKLHKKSVLTAACMFILSMSITSTIQSAAMPPSAFPGMDISEKELESLYNVLQNMSDDELQEIETLSKKMLADMGYDPETLKPINPTTPPLPSLPQKEHAAPMPPKAELKPIAEPEPPKITLESIPSLLSSLISQLTIIRTKASSTQSNDRRLNQWISDINELIYYLKVIDTPTQHKRLALPEFNTLRETLVRLNSRLTSATPSFSTNENDSELWENPYEMLNLEPSATQSQIEQAYDSLKHQIGPDAVRERLTREGLEIGAIKRAVKEAELSFEFITDAYEKIKEPESRAIINREREALQQKKDLSTGSTKKAIDLLTTAFSNAIYQEQVLNGLETFLKKYEPTQAEMRKRMEEAEAARLQEHKEFLARPVSSETKALHIKSTKGREYRPYDYGASLRGYEYPGARSGYSPSFYGGPSEHHGVHQKTGMSGKGEKSSGGGAPSGSGAHQAVQPHKEKEDEKKETPSENAPTHTPAPRAPEQEKEIDPTALKIYNLEEKIHKFNKNFDPEFFKGLEAEKTPLQEQIEEVKPADIEKNIFEYSQASHLNDVSDDLEYIKEKIEKAKDRKKQQYKTTLGGINKSDDSKNFKTNLEITQKALTTLEKSDGEVIKSVNKLVKTTLQNFDELTKLAEPKDRQKKHSLFSLT